MFEKLPQEGVIRKFLGWSGSESGKTILTCAIIVLVGLSGFGLGRLSAEKEEKPGLTIIGQGVEAISSAQTAAATGGTSPIGAGDLPAQAGEVVASKNGSKYHFPWCSGAKAISAANKITFTSAEEARKAGYLPASNCKGLQ